MKLRMAKYILASFCILAVMLIFLGSSMQSRTFCLGGIIVAFIGTVFWILFGRCPHCGKYLGKGNENYCPMLQFKSWYGDLDIFLLVNTIPVIPTSRKIGRRKFLI